MANELHVNGNDATQAMSNAIVQVSVDTPNPALEDLTVTGEMLSRARVGLVAAHAVTGDTAIAELLTALEWRDGRREFLDRAYVCTAGRLSQRA